MFGLQPGQLDRGHEQMGVWYQNLQGQLIRRRGTKMGVLHKTENRKENADLYSQLSQAVTLWRDDNKSWVRCTCGLYTHINTHTALVLVNIYAADQRSDSCSHLSSNRVWPLLNSDL